MTPTLSIHPILREQFGNYLRCQPGDPECCGYALWSRLPGEISLIQGRFETRKEAEDGQAAMEGAKGKVGGTVLL